jgi:3-isopropylmalate/(R)-2-methylmalate dehydratase small subunit
MESLVIHVGTTVALNRNNVDTDQILPKQFMKKIERTGYADCLFYNWRRGEDGIFDRSFELNRPEALGATILVAGDNFGCGSAREHAVWALKDYGFRVIVSSGFPPIFYSNCCNNGILPALVGREKLEILLSAAAGGARWEVDLRRQMIETGGAGKFPFEVDRYRRDYLLEGKEDIAVTLEHLDAILDFEKRQQRQAPWLW